MGQNKFPTQDNHPLVLSLIKTKLMESRRLPLHHPLIKTTYIDKSTMVMIKSQDFGLMVYYKAKHKLSTKMAIISEEVSKKVTKFKDS